VLDGFDCGRASSNVWLEKHARHAAAAGSARTYVVVDSEQARVVGYHALAPAGVEREAATARVIKRMPRYPIPVVLLARLAVDVSVARRGLGAWLLRNAMTRTLAASETIGAAPPSPR
jgi:predicted N-acetyltransferase YhbS